jgi:hypothetical protein
MYKITSRQKKIAKFLKVDILPSTNENKKIDVYKNGIKILSIGASGYKDYSIYLKEYGKEYANERQRLYKLRHAQDIKKKGSPGYYAYLILWS